MSFRLKTMLFIGVTEALFLLLLLWQSLAYLERSGEEALYRRALETSHLFSLLSKNAVISSDIAALDEITQQIAELDDIRYIRVLDSAGILAQAGDTSSLDSGFFEDSSIVQVDDGIFDAQALILESGVEFAKVQVGLPVDSLLLFITKARYRLFSIALAELIMVGLISLLLGRYLTKGLLALQKLALAVTKGDLSSRANNISNDELGITATAFNVMLDKINSDQKKLTDNAIHLTKAKQLAERASQAKSRFLSQMSHEIRSPLNAVLGAVNLVAEKIKEPPEHIQLLKTAQHSGSALLEVVNDILDFSKIEAGHMTLKRNEVKLAKLLEDVLNSAEAKIENQPNCDFTILGDVSKDCMGNVVTDTSRLRQVLSILVDNACSYTEQGYILVTLKRIKLAKGKDGLQVNVKDSGIGINKKHFNKIFEEFEQVDSRLEASSSGTGLGLNIARGLVSLMGGTIGVNSEPGQGSDFYFTLPVEFVSDIPLESAVIEGPMVLVSDNQTLRAIFTIKMQEMGIEFYGFGNLDILRNRTTQTLLSKKATWLIEDSIKVSDNNKLWLKSLDVSVTVISNLGARISKSYLGFKRVNRPILFHDICSPDFKGSADLLKVNSSTNNDNSAKKHILLVDDIAANRLIAGETLKNRGFQVDYACDGVEALEILEKQLFDVILMDIRMPRMNGFVAVEHLKTGNSINKSTPVIAMTANVEKSEVERCKAAGMDDFVGKPFDTQVLIDSINQCIHVREVTESKKPNNDLVIERVLSEEVLKRLTEDVTEDAVVTLIDLFIADVEERYQLINIALKGKDLEAVRDHSHALKSSAGSLGALSMFTFCKNLEKACVENNVSEAVAICKELKSIALSTIGTYKDYCKKYA